MPIDPDAPTNEPPVNTRRGDFLHGLRRRDRIILPAIFFGVLVLILGVMQIVFHFVFYQNLNDACMVPDKAIGQRAKPNCVSHYKVADSPWIENRYNACGYRTAESCGPVPPGTIRAAVIGSSLSAGYEVQYDQLFTTRAAAILTADCNRPVQFQNLGGIGYQWNRLYARTQEALQLKPKLLVMVFTPYDLEQPWVEKEAEPPPPEPKGLIPRIRRHFVDLLGVKQLSSWNAFLYFRVLNPDFFLKTFLQNPDGSGFLRPSWPPTWQKRVADLNTLLTHIASLSHQAGVPMTLIYSPDRAQVLLSRRKAQYPDYDPLALDRAVGAAARRLGIHFVDMTPALEKVPNVGADFYVMSDHLTPRGHALMASMLVNSILTSHEPAFAGCSLLPEISLK